MSEKPWVGKKIVIIDDSRAVREALKSSFTSLGLRVVGMAENGLDGLAAVREHQPDLVSLDIIMPEMDGIECYRKIKELAPDLKCLVNSWLSAEVKVINGLKEIMPPYIFQPKTTQTTILEARLAVLYNPQMEWPSPVGEGFDLSPSPTVTDLKAS